MPTAPPPSASQGKSLAHHLQGQGFADRRVPIDKKTGYFLEGNIDDTWGRFQEDPYIEVPFGEGNDTYKLLVNVKSPDHLAAPRASA